MDFRLVMNLFVLGYLLRSYVDIRCRCSAESLYDSAALNREDRHWTGVKAGQPSQGCHANNIAQRWRGTPFKFKGGWVCAAVDELRMRMSNYQRTH